MATIRPIRASRPEPEGMHDHAIENLRYIRSTMERAGSFTAVPGAGGVLMGLSALASAAATALWPHLWLPLWVGGAVAAVVIGIGTAARKARLAGLPLLAGPGRKFVAGLVPPIAAGALLTLGMMRAGTTGLIPSVWLLLYGTGVLAGGSASVRIVPVMGLCFMALGSLGMFLPSQWGNLLLAAGFGGIHIIFGIIIKVKYGG